MKSLILKDLYNIAGNMKSMVFILLFVPICMIMSSDGMGAIFFCEFMCAILILSTFAFDDNSKWNRYAMVMPVTKRELVASKFVVLLIFVLVGAAAGVIIGIPGEIIAGKVDYDPERIKECFIFAGVGICIATIIMGTIIPLTIKFGVEKARIFMFMCVAIPAGICYLAYKVITKAGIVITEEMITAGLYTLPVVTIAYCLVMYTISLKVFEVR